MQDIRFEKVSDDTTILAIGSLFRRIDNSQWGINLDLSPKAATASLRLSNIPVLARKRVLNPTQKHKSAGFRLSFRRCSLYVLVSIFTPPTSQDLALFGS